MVIKITLPIPPSVNGYWRTFRSRQIISKRGREYREQVRKILEAAGYTSPFSCRLAVTITYHFGDLRRRDLDNYTKSLLDACAATTLQSAAADSDGTGRTVGLFLDDSQIDTLLLTRASIDRENPRAVVELFPIEDR